jgi:hypothetical protein
MKKKTLIDKVLKIIQAHQNSAEVILDDYLVNTKAVKELAEVNCDLIEDLTLLLEDDESDFEMIVEKLEAMDKKVIDGAELIEKFCEESEIMDAASTYCGVIILKNLNLKQRIEVEDFITNNIYPLHRDQIENVLL